MIKSIPLDGVAASDDSFGEHGSGDVDTGGGGGGGGGGGASVVLSSVREPKLDEFSNLRTSTEIG